MKTVRGFVIGFVVAMAIGGVAGAAPAIVHAVSASHHGPAKAHGPGPSTHGDAESPDREQPGDEGGPAGHTGLANAIDHVSANLADHPNTGLANALSHLKANQARHQARDDAKQGAQHGGTGGKPPSPSTH